MYQLTFVINMIECITAAFKTTDASFLQNARHSYANDEMVAPCCGDCGDSDIGRLGGLLLPDMVHCKMMFFLQNEVTHTTEKVLYYDL